MSKQSENRDPMDKGKLVDIYLRALQLSVVILLLFVVAFFYWTVDPSMGTSGKRVALDTSPRVEEEDPEAVVNGIHVRTGLVVDAAFPLIRANCTSCHSGKLITQNRADREGWKDIIRWMQATQKLWDLGDQEDAILDYLAEHYAPDASGRRKLLSNIDWYELKK